MPALHRKLLRDIAAARAQFGAVILIVVLGVAAFVGSYSAYVNLSRSYDRSFDELRMADYWISVDRLEERAVREIDEIAGVLAQGRIVGSVHLDLAEESGERVEGRVVSLPREHHPPVNDVQLVRGSYFSASSSREILVEKRLADYHTLEPGDWLTLESQGTHVRFRIAGVVASPEYIWAAKSLQEPFPLPRTFGVLFMAYPEAEEFFGMKGLVNEVDLLVAPGIDDDDVLRQVTGILRKYEVSRLTLKDEPVRVETRKIDVLRGVRTAYAIEQEDQPSNRLLRMDLEGFRELAYLFPVLFLAMACLAIYVLLNRLVESQRVQIGLMRALGYGKPAVLFHYLGFALVVGLAGSLIGGAAGLLLARVLTDQYAQELNLPFVVVQTQWEVVVLGVAVGIVMPVLAGLLPAWATSRMRPAEAMRPARPSAGHRSFVEAVLPFLSRLPYVLKLPLRNAFRNFRRTLFMAAGVASAIVLVLVSMGFVDAMESMMGLLFGQIQNYDARIIFQGTAGSSTVSYVGQLDGVQEAEAVLEAPYRVRHGDRVYDGSIMAMPEGSSLYGLYTPEGEPTAVVDGQILLPIWLKEKLDVEVGDRLELMPLVGTVGETEKQLAGFVNEPLGGKVFMPLDDAQKLLRSPGAATAVLLTFEGEPSAALLQRLYDLPQTASIELGGDFRAAIDEMMGFFWIFIGVMLAMGAALGFAIVFNGVTVNVLERRREIAIMRAVGMDSSQLGIVLTLENLLVGLVGIAIGIPLGYVVTSYFFSMFETDVFSLSAVILPRSYVVATVAAVVILLLSQLPAMKQLSRLSLSTATKDWAE